MRMYLKLDDYYALGGELEPDVFERMGAKAERLIDRATHGRLKAQDDVPMSVKYCIMELIGALQADESMGNMVAGREISSMSNDGVSMSFASSGASGAMAASARHMAIIRGWLDGEVTEDGVQLLYAGCDA